jgi:hypothetical protein
MHNSCAYAVYFWAMSGAAQKTETLNLRVSPALKAALQAAARREHRSMANMVEHLVLGYCEQHGLAAERDTDGVDAPEKSS